ncbi:MAG: SRPBCC domain-containing protein [Thermoleophilia bacterium]|nr:SRPBCC domain-containing protein [Thermoleophilia bacterium]
MDAVEVEVRIAASPETVFDFFTDPKLMVQWMGRRAELDPRPGGGFRTEINDEAIASGTYVAVEPPERVVFTWGWNGEDSVTPPGSSTVEVLLAADADGDGTHLRLIHHDLPSAESATKHGHGWRHYTERLRIAATGSDPGPDEFAEPPGDEN